MSIVSVIFCLKKFISFPFPFDVGKREKGAGKIDEQKAEGIKATDNAWSDALIVAAIHESHILKISFITQNQPGTSSHINPRFIFGVSS